MGVGGIKFKATRQTKKNPNKTPPTRKTTITNLLDDDQVEDRDVRLDDAATDRLPPTVTLAALGEAGVVTREQQAGALRDEHALLHRETLLVVTARDAEDVAGKLLAEGLARDLLHPKRENGNRYF